MIVELVKMIRSHTKVDLKIGKELANEIINTFGYGRKADDLNVLKEQVQDLRNQLEIEKQKNLQQAKYVFYLKQTLHESLGEELK